MACTAHCFSWVCNAMQGTVMEEASKVIDGRFLPLKFFVLQAHKSNPNPAVYLWSLIFYSVCWGLFRWPRKLEMSEHEVKIWVWVRSFWTCEKGATPTRPVDRPGWSFQSFCFCFFVFSWSVCFSLSCPTNSVWTCFTLSFFAISFIFKKKKSLKVESLGIWILDYIEFCNI